MTQEGTILIVDDKQANILALETLLAADERVFLNATNGNDALTLLLNKAVDLIILDVNMPDMDGFEVAQIIKTNKRTRDIPIIFASAEKKEHYNMMKGFEAGAIDYLSKPLDPEIAKAKVAVLLKVQLQKKELLEKNISLQKSALLINNSADIIGIIDLQTLKIEEINQAFTAILGYPVEEVKDTAITFFLDTDGKSLVEELAKSGKDTHSFESRIFCKDRAIKWLQWKVVAKDDKWFVNARDITEERHAEKIKDYLATVVKQSADAIYIHDSVGQIISWNDGAEKIYGYSEDEALKMKIWNVIPDYMQQQTQEMIADILQGEKVQSLQTKRVTHHGNLIDVMFSASEIIDPGSLQKSIAITERDITQQLIADEEIKQLNDYLQRNVIQLEAVNQELETFSYSVSHDLRAPLRIINGYSDILSKDYEEKLDANGKKILDVIHNNTIRMGSLIDGLLNLARFTRKELTLEHTDMAHLVSEVIEEQQTLAKKQLNIKAGPLSPVACDPVLIRQVWTNLVSNAIKYSGKRDDQHIEVGSYQKDKDIIYFVRDNGVGFDMEYSDKLFGVFQRLHNRSEYEGTGVGLALAQRILNKHRGRIWAESEVNKGATFYFSLPAA